MACVQSGSTPSNVHSQLYDQTLGDRKENPTSFGSIVLGNGGGLYATWKKKDSTSFVVGVLGNGGGYTFSKRRDPTNIGVIVFGHGCGLYPS
jgi:hypothetical protein